MELRNRWGTAVDAVPFIVVFATSFAICYSFGPIYFLSFDLELPAALGVSTGVFALLGGSSYYRLIWSFRPEYRTEIPVAARLRRLMLTTVVGIGVLGLLAVPFFAS